MCDVCVIQLGKITFLDETSHCTLCRNNTTKIENSYAQKVCLDCWWEWNSNPRAKAGHSGFM